MRLISEVVDHIETAVAICDANSLDIIDCNDAFRQWLLYYGTTLTISQLMPELDAEPMLKAVFQGNDYQCKQPALDQKSQKPIHFRFSLQRLNNNVNYLLVQGGRDPYLIELENQLQAYKELEKRRRAELIQEKVDAEEKNRAKSVFLARMSHELRTPLNSVLGFTRILKRKSKGTLPEQQRSLLDTILSNADKLLILVNDLLDISRIEAGKLQLCLEDIDANQIVNECYDALLPLAEQNHLGLNINLPPNPVSLHADHQRLMQIVSNLMTNAIKYTQQGQVDVSVQQTQQYGHDVAIIEIVDTGIGIDQALIPQLFESFSRIESAETKGIEGTGLGLKVVAELVKLHQGTVDVESELGRGSRFRVTLPLPRKP